MKMIKWSCTQNKCRCTASSFNTNSVLFILLIFLPRSIIIFKIYWYKSFLKFSLAASKYQFCYSVSDIPHHLEVTVRDKLCDNKKNGFWSWNWEFSYKTKVLCNIRTTWLRVFQQIENAFPDAKFGKFNNYRGIN